VGKAQRAHHLKRGKNGGHVAALLLPTLRSRRFYFTVIASEAKQSMLTLG
jgi:hypothetical protein